MACVFVDRTALDLEIQRFVGGTPSTGCEDIKEWDVGRISDFSRLFENISTFNGDISKWNTDSATDMNHMFSGALNFNSDLSDWNTTQVTDLSFIFQGAIRFDKFIGKWETSSVTSLRGAFYRATSFDRSLRLWNTERVVDLSLTFADALAFSGPNDFEWDTRHVTTMSETFARALSFNGDVSTFDVSSVTSLESTFEQTNAFNADISKWDVSSVRSLKRTFEDASAYNVDLSAWNVSRVTEIDRETFSGTSALSDCVKHHIYDHFSGMLQNTSRALFVSEYNATWSQLGCTCGSVRELLTGFVGIDGSCESLTYPTMSCNVTCDLGYVSNTSSAFGTAECSQSAYDGDAPTASIRCTRDAELDFGFECVTEGCVDMDQDTGFQCPDVENASITRTYGDAIPATSGGDLVVFRNVSLPTGVSASDYYIVCGHKEIQSLPCFSRDSNQSLACEIPPGQGSALDIRLLRDEVPYVVDTHLLSGCSYNYARPRISYTSGESPDGCESNGCSRVFSESQIVSIHGYNFGHSNGLVFIVAEECAMIGHGFANSSCTELEASDEMCHQLIRCVVPALTTPSTVSNGILVTQSGLFGSERGFLYEQCVSNEYQVLDDATGLYICASCSYGKTSSHADALSCDPCNFMYVGSANCDFPVLLIIVVTVSSLLISIFVAKLFRNYKKMLGISIALEGELMRNKRLLRAKTTDLELMGRARQVDESEIRIIRKIGEGAYGSVHEASLHGTWRVAVKRLKQQKNGADASSRGSAIARRSFLREKEVQFLMRARHERLVMFLGGGNFKDDDSVFFVFEYMNGGSYSDLLYDQGKDCPFSERLQILKDTADGLAYLHLLAKSVHLDLKSANILLSKPTEDETGNNRYHRAKLSDFGLSVMVRHGKRRISIKHHTSSKNAERAAAWTKHMSGFIGSAEWMAPELMVADANYGPPADIFSFAMVMFESLIRRKPWSNISRTDIFESVRTGKRPHIPKTKPVDAQYVSLMARCWNQSMKERPLVDEVVNELQKILDETIRRRRRESAIRRKSSSKSVDGTVELIEVVGAL